MARNKRDLLQEASELPAQERRWLALQLLEGAEERVMYDPLDDRPIGPEEQAAVDAAWSTEIARRIQSVKDGTAELLTLEECDAEMDDLFKELGLGPREVVAP